VWLEVNRLCALQVSWLGNTLRRCYDFNVSSLSMVVCLTTLSVAQSVQRLTLG
jgi:hypothetical protein